MESPERSSGLANWDKSRRSAAAGGEGAQIRPAASVNSLKFADPHSARRVWMNNVEATAGGGPSGMMHRLPRPTDNVGPGLNRGPRPGTGKPKSRLRQMQKPRGIRSILIDAVRYIAYTLKSFGNALALPF